MRETTDSYFKLHDALSFFLIFFSIGFQYFQYQLHLKGLRVIYNSIQPVA